MAHHKCNKAGGIIRRGQGCLLHEESPVSIDGCPAHIDEVRNDANVSYITHSWNYKIDNIISGSLVCYLQKSCVLLSAKGCAAQKSA